MDEIVKLTKKYNIELIEDSAETLGATWKKNKQVLLELVVFLFSQQKILLQQMEECSQQIIKINMMK